MLVTNLLLLTLRLYLRYRLFPLDKAKLLSILEETTITN